MAVGDAAEAEVALGLLPLTPRLVIIDVGTVDVLDAVA